jgi:hypothetical protein
MNPDLEVKIGETTFPDDGSSSLRTAMGIKTIRGG